MAETDQLRQALSELVGDIKRGVSYFEELGIAEYSEIPDHIIAHREPVISAAESGQQNVAQPPPATATPNASAPAEPRLAELISRSREPLMAGQKKTTPAVAQASLFGEPVPNESPAEPELPVNETLEAIRADIGDCTRCKLHQQRTHIVFGEGNPRAALMFIGEGPGADEDATGRPFVGRAGQLLDRMIEAIGLRRDDCYIGNVVKCRPPGNREPEPGEVATCEPFLFRQISVIKPRLVVALGATAAKTLLRTKAPISKLRGHFFDFRGTKLLPTFHPAFLLRSPNMKKEAWEDMKKVRDFLHGKIVE
jgi:DNA polymerase